MDQSPVDLSTLIERPPSLKSSSPVFLRWWRKRPTQVRFRLKLAIFVTYMEPLEWTFPVNVWPGLPGLASKSPS